MQEANFNYLKEHDFADRSIFAFARFRPEQLYFFYQLTRGYTENNQALHGRLTEIFADHVAKCHAALLKPNYAGAPISQTVRQEVYPELLYMLRGGFHPDKDPLTSGGDLIVQFTDGFTINLQLKTIFSSTGRDRGGNPIRLSVIIETLKKWQKALKETKPENIANKLFSAQSTKA